LLFVLGSGINVPYGIPDWSTLLVELLLDSGRVRKATAVGKDAITETLHEVIHDPLLQAVAVRSAFARNDQWLAVLRKRLSLYDRAEVVSPENPIGKVASIIAEQYLRNRDRHIAVLSFNYDRLLEVALEAALPPADLSAIHTISGEKAFFSAIHRAGIWVYHLHGYIDHPDSDIVLDAASYVSVLASPGRHWSWHCMNTYLFHEESAALFLGLSLLDPSLRLLLTQAAVRGLALSGIYVYKPFPTLREIEIDALRNRAFAAHDIVQLFDGVLRELSLIPYHVKSWTELPALLDIIAEEAE
jgi:hypothetical protein